MIGMALFAVLMCVNFLACSNENEEIAIENKSYEVKLSLGGEYVDVSESPLSRTSTPKKYYAMNVYSIKADGTQNSYVNYAYGVFDNISDMKITLYEGYKYKFSCTSIVEGEDKFSYNGEYLESPFFVFGGNPFYLSELNTFITSSNLLLQGIFNGTTHTADGKISEYPRMDRYYGELAGYVPSEKNTAVISMKRTVFGLKIIIDGVPDGSLSWYTSPNLLLNKTSHNNQTSLEFASTYVMSNVFTSWSLDNHTEPIDIFFTWTRGDGSIKNFKQSISVKRNVMTNVNVSLKDGSNYVSFDFKDESSTMTDETINVNYDGGSI